MINSLHARMVFAGSVTRAFILALLVAYLPSMALADVTITSPSGVTATVTAATGAYTVNSASPAWTFSGSVGYPVTGLMVTAGADKIGKYRQTLLCWTDIHPYLAVIRVYNATPIVSFSLQTIDPLTGPLPDFPTFTTFPSGLHPMSYADGVFSPHSFSLQKTSTPWILFDNSANTAVFSPESDFMVSEMHGDGKETLSSGMVPSLSTVPAGFTHSSILTFGAGVESTLHRWGDALTALSGKSQAADDADPLVKYFGYWTDNGAAYYYNYDQSKGYAATILAVKNEFDQDQIPLHYMQLDSWWYQKSLMSPEGQMGSTKNPALPEGTWNRYGGTLDYSASPALFPSGLASFQQSLGLPLVVHGRWIDPASPYHQNYKFSGVAAIDPQWWDDRTDYLAKSGVACYEQDWLVDIYGYSPELKSNLAVADAFTDNMARATQAHGQTMQYCMPTPRFFLEGSKYPNLTTIRTSTDGFVRERWNDFFYTGILADALHIRPFTDTLMSSDYANILIATLSTGPVGVGDKMGTESKENIMRAIRSDGMIVKPDASLLPTDASILADSAGTHNPLICFTYTNNGVRTGYILAFARSGDTSTIEFTPAASGFSGNVYICPLNGAAILQDAGTPYTDTLDADGWQYYTIAPVGKSGIAFLGDSGKFVGTGRQRIPSISDTARGLTANVELCPGEAITLTGYSDSAPKVAVTNGVAGPVNFNPVSKLFSVVVRESSTSSAVAVVTVRFSAL